MTFVDSDLSRDSELDKDDNEATEGVLFLLLCLPRRVNKQCPLAMMCFSGCVPCPVALTALDNKFELCLPSVSLPPSVMNHPWGSAAQVLWLLSKVRIKCPGKRWIRLCPRRYLSFFTCICFAFPFRGKWGETQWVFLTHKRCEIPTGVTVGTTKAVMSCWRKQRIPKERQGAQPAQRRSFLRVASLSSAVVGSMRGQKENRSSTASSVSECRLVGVWEVGEGWLLVGWVFRAYRYNCCSFRFSLLKNFFIWDSQPREQPRKWT